MMFYSIKLTVNWKLAQEVKHFILKSTFLFTLSNIILYKNPINM